MAKSKGDSAQDKLINLQAQQLAAQVANWAATLDFQKERFRLLEMPQFQTATQLEIDKLAWQKATDTWEQAFKESTLTGMYNGQPTQQWLMDQARLTGSFNGQRTLEGQLNDAQIQDMHDKMKLANDQFLAATTGYMNGQKTFDREKFETDTAIDAWKFISGLTGASNAFKQARAIASTPGGVSQLMDAFAGQYGLSASGAVGSSGGHFNLGDMMQGAGGAYTPMQGNTPGQPVTVQPIGSPGGGARPAPAPGAVPALVAPATPPAYPYSGSPSMGLPQEQWNDTMYAAVQEWNATHPGYIADGSPQGYHLIQDTMPVAQVPGYSYQPPGVQAPVNAYNYSQTPAGGMAVYPPGVTSPAATPDVSTQQPIPMPVATSIYSYGGDPAQQGGTALPQSSLPLPSQINARNYDNAYQYQKDLVWANYADQGWDPGLAQESFQKSLPKYGGASKGAVAF